jgi:hypothetical protein
MVVWRLTRGGGGGDLSFRTRTLGMYQPVRLQP